MTRHGDTEKKIPHIVVAGGGFGGMEFIKKLRSAPVRITLIDKNNYHTFQPLLYQVASGGLGAESIGYPYRLIFRGQKNLRYRLAVVEKIFPERKEIQTSTGIISYDYLVLATGSTTNYFGNKEIEKWSMPMKSIPDALDLRSDLLQEFEVAVNRQRATEQQQHMTFVIVGGGPTGVETAGAFAEFKSNVLPHDYPELDPSLMKVYLVEAGPRLLAGFSEKSGQNALKYLKEMGVDVLLNTVVDRFNGQEVVFKDGQKLSSSTLVWSAGVKGVMIDGLPAECTAGNRFKVDEFNRVQCMGEIYAIGDAAGMYTAERPKGFPMVAPVATQQGKLLAANILNIINGKPLNPFKYRDKGSMATVGRNKAVVDLPFWKFGGFFAFLVWMFLHLMLLVGFRNRVVVFIHWMWNYFTYERALRLIVRKFEGPKKEVPAFEPAPANNPAV